MFFRRKKLKKNRKRKCLGTPTTPEDQTICLFAGFLANQLNPYVPLSLTVCFSRGNVVIQHVL